MAEQRVVGQTKSVGFQVGVRRTFPVPVQVAWDFLISEEGQRIWLGASSPIEVTEGTDYCLQNGTEGTIRVVNPEENIRLSWQPQTWSGTSTIQVRTIPSTTGTTISFHQEKLAGPKERAEMRRHWQHVLAELETHLVPPQL